jgi:hypothetical protein
MKTFRQAAKYGASLATVVAAPAFAAVPAGLTTAIEAGTTDTGTVALGMLLLAVGILVYKWFRKAL